MRRDHVIGLIDLVAAAYHPRLRHGHAAVEYVPGRDFGAVVVSLHDRVLVAFPGTTSLAPQGTGGTFALGLRQWLTNLTIVQHDLGPYALHAGYLSEAQAMLPGLTQAIRDHGGADKTVVFAGHSAGGAIAQATAALLVDHADLPVDRVLAFAAPRVGDRRFSARMTDRVVRLERRADIVPHLPFSPRVARHATAAVDVLSHLVPQLVTPTALRRLREAEYVHAGRVYWYDWEGDWLYTSPGGYLAGLWETLRQPFGGMDAYPMPAAIAHAGRFVVTLDIVEGLLAADTPSFLMDHHVTEGIRRAFVGR